MSTAPKSVAALVLIICVSSLIEGGGVLLLLPLLSLTDMMPMATDGIYSSVGMHLDALGLQSLSITAVLVIYCGLIACIATLKRSKHVKTDELRQQIITGIRQSLYTNLVSAAYGFLSQKNPTDISHFISAQASRVAYACFMMIQMLSSVILLLVYCVMMTVVSWKSLLMVMAVGVLSMLMLFPIQKYIKRDGNAAMKTNLEFNEHVMHYITTLKQVKASANEVFAIARFEKLNADLTTQTKTFARQLANSKWIYDVAGIIMLSFIFWVALTVLQLPVTSLVLLLVFCARVMPRAASLIDFYQRVTYIVPGFDAIMDMVREAKDHAEYADSVSSVSFESMISLESVVFSYSDKPILSAFSGQIKRGMMLGLRGPSGAGKTTLLDLISGLRFPDDGHVKIDDTVLDSKTARSWRYKIAYLNQQPLLYRGSVRDNMTWGLDPQPSDSAVYDVLAQVNATQIVTGLSDGLDAELADYGANLSGGEKQRLCLARLLLRGAEVLILDEALNHLDQETREELFQTLKTMKGSVTMIVVSHDPYVFDLCDQVWEIGVNDDD